MSKIIVTVSVRSRTQVIYEDMKGVREVATIRRGTSLLVANGRRYLAQWPADRVIDLKKSVKVGRHTMIKPMVEKVKAVHRNDVKPKKSQEVTAPLAEQIVKEEDPLAPSTSGTDTGADLKDFEVVLGEYLETAGLDQMEALPVLTEEQLDEILVLVDHTLDAVVQYIKEKNCQNIITITGAGTSTAAGVPDYAYLQTLCNLTVVDIFFDYDAFIKYPFMFYSVLQLMNPKYRIPTRTHYFIRLLQEKGILLRHYTKNFDTLDCEAGIDSEKLVEIFGSLRNSYCLNCSAEYDQNWMEEKLEYKGIPQCEQCGGIVKPDIELSGNRTVMEWIMSGRNVRLRPEEYGKQFWEVDKENCDLLIIMGCDIGTYPIDKWIRGIPKEVPRLFINKELTGQVNVGTRYEFRGLDFNPTNNSRDAFWKGNCDDGCQLLADKLGWGEELKHLIEAESTKIKRQIPNDLADWKMN